MASIATATQKQFRAATQQSQPHNSLGSMKITCNNAEQERAIGSTPWSEKSKLTGTGNEVSVQGTGGVHLLFCSDNAEPGSFSSVSSWDVAWVSPDGVTWAAHGTTVRCQSPAENCLCEDGESLRGEVPQPYLGAHSRPHTCQCLCSPFASCSISCPQNSGVPQHLLHVLTNTPSCLHSYLQLWVYIPACLYPCAFTLCAVCLYS